MHDLNLCILDLQQILKIVRIIMVNDYGRTIPLHLKVVFCLCS